MYDLIAISIPVLLIIGIVIAIRVISEAGVRKRLAETQTDPEVIRVLLDTTRKQREGSAMTWAIMLVLMGLAMITVGLLELTSADPLTYGLLSLAAGSGLVVALIVNRLQR